MTLPNSDLFIINRNGVNYQVDFNSLKKYIPGIPAGSRCLFFMDSAPYGWTIDRNSKFTEASVRVVSGAGGGSGGSQNFSTIHKVWTTSVVTHNHGVSAGNHKHGSSFTHNHTLNDPGHTHTMDVRSINSLNYDSSLEQDILVPLYTDGASDGEVSYTNFKVSIGDSPINDSLPPKRHDDELSEFLHSAYDLLHESEFIESEIYSALLFEVNHRNSLEGFINILQSLSDFSDGLITQVELNTVVDNEISRLELLKGSTPTPGSGDCLYYRARGSCADGGDDSVTSCKNNQSYQNYESGTVGPIVSTGRYEEVSCQDAWCSVGKCDSSSCGDWIVDCYKKADPKPEPIGAGISINSASPNVGFSNSTASGLSTTNTTGTVGTSIDFTVKYHKGIVCQKDPY